MLAGSERQLEQVLRRAVTAAVFEGPSLRLMRAVTYEALREAKFCVCVILKGNLANGYETN